MNDVKPAPVLMIVGGVVIAISTLIGWGEVLTPAGPISENAWDKGLLGLYQTIIGLGVAFFGAALISGRRISRGKIAGLRVHQWMIALPVAVALWGFAFQFDDSPEIGVLTTWVGGVIAAAGAVMSDRQLLRTRSNNAVPNY